MLTDSLLYNSNMFQSGDGPLPLQVTTLGWSSSGMAGEGMESQCAVCQLSCWCRMQWALLAETCGMKNTFVAH